MNKTIISITIGVLVLGGLIWMARPDGENSLSVLTASSGTLAVEETSNYDFGSVSMAAGKVSHQFTIKNISGEAVVINKMYTSCMCTTATLITADGKFGPVGMPGHGVIPSINLAIDPNEEAIVDVVFDPAAHGPAGVGLIQRVVTLENNAGAPVELQFSATVTP